jgi:hypothetical protein
MGFNEILGGADHLQGLGGKFAGTTEQLAAEIKAKVAEIESIESARPWGAGDDTADAVEKTYNQPTAGGPFAQAVNDQVEGMVDEGVEIGPKVITAASEYLAQDLDAAAAIHNVRH